MNPRSEFLKQPKYFWANVRTISQAIGYTTRGKNQIKIPETSEIKKALEGIGLRSSHLVGKGNKLTTMGATLLAYFAYRADILNNYVKPRLMDVARARSVFKKLLRTAPPTWQVPMNKQKGKKKTPAYFTGIINLLVETNAEGFPCNFAPRALTTVTRDGKPLRTLARWVDGAFPSEVNPIAVWEIKEYYYTTTFGSRVADGVYESLLDGMELEELREHEGIDVKHFLMVDDYNTWWNMGRSYLCRIIDMLHMGYVDEVLFGYEAVERLPKIVKEWVRIERGRPS